MTKPMTPEQIEATINEARRLLDGDPLEAVSLYRGHLAIVLGQLDDVEAERDEAVSTAAAHYERIRWLEAHAWGRDELRAAERERDEAREAVARLACDVAAMSEKRDEARRERDEARSDFLACAEAIGVVYEADGHATKPGPVEAVVEHIREAVRAERERDEARASLAVAERQRDAAWSELGAGPVGREDCGCVPCSGCIWLRVVGAACSLCGTAPVPAPARIAAAVARAYENAAQIADRYGHAHIAAAIRAARGAL